MKPLIERTCKLLTVKSIVTIILTAVVAYLAVIGKIDIEKCILLLFLFTLELRR